MEVLFTIVILFTVIKSQRISEAAMPRSCQARTESETSCMQSRCFAFSPKGKDLPLSANFLIMLKLSQLMIFTISHGSEFHRLMIHYVKKDNLWPVLNSLPAKVIS